MKLPKQLIESLTSSEGSRYVLNGVLLDTERKLLIATDGHMLAAIPAEPEKGDQTGIIPFRAWKMARAIAKRIPRKIRPTVSAVIQVLKHKVVLRGVDETCVLPKLSGNFPSWPAVVTGVKPKVEVALDIELLYRLSQALCDPGGRAVLTLFVEDGRNAVGVMAESGVGVGVIMPVRTGGQTLRSRWEQLNIVSKSEAAKA